MFDAGLDRLLDALPDIEGMSAHRVREMLTGAFLDILAIRDLGSQIDTEPHLEAARRVATALELHAVLDGDFGSAETRACAFVAAEALELVRDLSGLTGDTEEERIGAIPVEQYAAMESGALYLIAGFDANAAVAARAITPEVIEESDADDASVAARVAVSAKALFELRSPPDDAVPSTPEGLSMAMELRWEVSRRTADSIDSHLRWLLRGEEPKGSPADELRQLSETLEESGRFPDESHLAYLFGEACRATERRSLRNISGNDAPIWSEYVERRSRTRPLLWPAAQEYATGVVQGEASHAVVSVPTGAGKSAVAELAIAHDVGQGWVLYLTPTNALAAQVVRDLDAQFGVIDGIEVKGFLGGAEYTELPGERIENVHENQILVMTPEKCSLALRQAPEAFDGLQLLVMDECHLLGDSGSRGVNAELTISEVLHRAPNVKVLFLSALVANPDELAGWLSDSTSREAQVVSEPWRPTRTLRALLGIDAERADEPYQEAVKLLEEKAHRKKATFEAPVALLASYQGAWQSIDAGDYAVVPADLTVPLSATRKNDGTFTVERGGYVNQAAGLLSAQLALRDERVLTFLPANKHHSFSVARDLPNLGPQPSSDSSVRQVAALLDLADYELGVPSALRELIDKGVAVHTSAMLRDEQRASELAFANGQARAMFATGTLAQGLNLPATAVVIGGTRVGDDRHLSDNAREERARAQLLNAIGRAGRAYVASRSIGIVIPDKWIGLRPGESPEAARKRAPFLEYPDASTEVVSRIQALIRTALDMPDVQIGQLTSEEEAAFTFLASSDPEDSQGVIRRSYGAFREGLDAGTSRQVSDTLDQAGQIFVESVGAPSWIVEASHISGIGLPAIGALHRAFVPAVEKEPPSTIGDWRDALITTLSKTPASIVASLLPLQPFENTEMDALVQPADGLHVSSNDGVAALDRSLEAWMNGDPITALAEPALGREIGDGRRGSGHSLPKLIALTEHGFGFGLSRIAGALGALVSVGDEADVELFSNLDAQSRLALDLFPIAIRFGCEDRASTAWYRWGFRRRRLAHLLARAFPPPDGIDDQDLGGWITVQRKQLLAGELNEGVAADEMALLEALRAAPG